MISELIWGWYSSALYILNLIRIQKRYMCFIFLCLLTSPIIAQTPIWLEDFNSYTDGTIVGFGNRWIITTTPDINAIDPDDYFKIVNNQLELKDSNWNEQVFTTESIDISAYTDISLSFRVSEIGDLESFDYVNAYYSIDTGAGFGVEISFAVNGLNTDDFNERTMYQAGLNGLMIKVIIRLKNSADAEHFRIDDIRIQSEEPGYFDSDSDGIFNNIDIDDDNDGILDDNEELSCQNSPISHVVNYGNSQSFCDTDNDGIANVFDLDSDDDGIPDVVESGLGHLNNGSGYIDYSNSLTWFDDNADGLHDAIGLTYVTLNTDGDLTPDYLDLDSDNDTLFDIDESQAGNSNKEVNYENGDADITGDGTGDYPESELFREKDTNDDDVLELFGDGIQDVYEHIDGLYGNTGQEDPYHTLEPITDNLPNYIDLDSDNNGVYDIYSTLYGSLDANNDGAIDDISDADGDGIVDVFDTNDAIFGSPRNLNTNLYVHFDGRNDYVQDENILNNDSQATLMAWINIDDAFNSTGFILGQDSFNIKLNSSKELETTINGTSIISGIILSTRQWIHVAAIFNGNTRSLKLYINGANVASNASVSSNLGSDSSLFTMAKNPSLDAEYFFGGIEEVRVFDITLTELQLQKIVYQKIKNNGNLLGEIIPFDIDIPWSNLVRYYRMDIYQDDIIDDRAQSELVIDEYSSSYTAKCFNIKDIRKETAPMPFTTEYLLHNLDLGIAVSQNNDVRGEDVKEIDWSITHVKHNITLDVDHSDIGLLIDSGITVKLNDDTFLNNDWYLKLDGVIDLNGGSQLVQTTNSYLDVSSLGHIERDQQGSANSYTYNYWSSPVSLINSIENNKEFYLKEVLFDGTIPNASSRNISFGPKNDPYYSDGGSMSELKLSSYWLWRFVNTQTNDYTNWEWVGSGNESGSKKLHVTEGYSMKGTSGDKAIISAQNYVFLGKPNNAPISNGIRGGDLIHTNFEVSFDSDVNPRISLAGNPFPSAIDAHTFIDDNENSINGQLYFWEHWGGDSHVLKSYQGGYGILNKAGGVAAPSHPDICQIGKGSKVPKRYIPVGQGFFVIQKHDVDEDGKPILSYGGDVVFKNSQRLFVKEDLGESLFIKGSKDKVKFKETANIGIKRIRFVFEGSDGYKRALLLAFLEGASDDIDYGYDAVPSDYLSNDALFVQDERDFVIQSFGEFVKEREIPISIIIDENGKGKIQRIYVESFENFDKRIKVYLKDHQNRGEIFEITDATFETILEPGEHKNRFSIVFQERNNRRIKYQRKISKLKVSVKKGGEELVIQKDMKLSVNQILLFNSLGQIMKTWNDGINSGGTTLDIHFSNGVYFLILETSEGMISKKIIIR